ncbi:hypothetical protein GCM10017788_26120 [Amycolatopsis acidiphila]|nr:hypothetical protein GCM10017788_26120 [Amycolatopsis acidiphila]
MRDMLGEVTPSFPARSLRRSGPDRTSVISAEISPWVSTAGSWRRTDRVSLPIDTNSRAASSPLSVTGTAGFVVTARPLVVVMPVPESPRLAG